MICPECGEEDYDECEAADAADQLYSRLEEGEITQEDIDRYCHICYSGFHDW